MAQSIEPIIADLANGWLKSYKLPYKPQHLPLNSEITNEPSFWKSCQTCKNYDVLQRTSETMCLCTVFV